MKPDQFLQLREADWRELDDLLNRATKQPKSLTPTDATRLGDLYRAATSDLALARRDFPQDRVTSYLNQLVGRSHSLLYRKRRVSWERVWHYFRADIPLAFRQNIRLFGIAMVLLFGPALLAGILSYIDPELARFLLPPSVQGLIPEIEAGRLWTEIEVSQRPLFSSLITTNNIQVSFLAFAGGMLAGIFTTYILIFNGLMLGGILGLTFHYGIGWGLTEFVIAHGVVELSVIGIAGAAGLMLGRALVRPGLLSRGDALRIAARDAVKLAISAVPLLIVAGLIEGFISPNEFIPFAVKIAVGLGTGALMYTWLLLGGTRIFHLN